jgi:hypothetical protein
MEWEFSSNFLVRTDAGTFSGISGIFAGIFSDIKD